MSTTDSTDQTTSQTTDLAPPGDDFARAAILADEHVPAIHIWRDFRATPAQVMHAHTDRELFAHWIGPHDLETRIDVWDCRTLGSYRYVQTRGEEEYAFRGTFPEVSEDRIVQTFCFEPWPDAIALETMSFTDLGDGRTRLHAFSLCSSFEARDGMVASGMETGVHEGYASLDTLLAAQPSAPTDTQPNPHSPDGGHH